MPEPLVEYAGIRFVALADTDSDRLAVALSDERVRRWMSRDRGPVRGLLDAAAGLAAAGRAAHFALEQGDGGPVGWCAILPYAGQAGRLQTSTYLSPAVWGFGFNRAVKAALWEIGVAHGHDRLLLSVHRDNTRSLAACRRLTGQAGSAVTEPWVPRHAVLFELRRPTSHLDFGATERAMLRDRMRKLPSWPALATATADRSATGADVSAP